MRGDGPFIGGLRFQGGTSAQHQNQHSEEQGTRRPQHR
ncbi:hypothetical protein DB31_2993 [Hyalangium minutum]|uniref:Uncharacterized protein n=1 Tax=Hyalangium minutum TaxID=394096 RepID=A0A085W5H1_9BACT|nr:hypothetical protein DB31_2993 [Hyalangium minutum]